MAPPSAWLDADGIARGIASIARMPEISERTHDTSAES
jgi:hypothetical protein